MSSLRLLICDACDSSVSEAQAEDEALMLELEASQLHVKVGTFKSQRFHICRACIEKSPLAAKLISLLATPR